MANPEHLAKLTKGVEEWNRWRKEHPEIRPDLAEADLSGTDLSRAYLSLVSLSRANLIEADLRRANLSQADLSSVNLLYANLAGAWLTGADLGRAHFEGTSLNGSDFTGASVWATRFINVDLSGAAGLDDVRHFAPSTIGIDTIYKSQGKIPAGFLLGCGVPGEFIAYVKSIAGAFDFYSCFISDSTKDQEFADRLYADLQNKGVRCWFAPHDIHGGRKIHQQLDEAIRMHDKLLLVLSEHSMNSNWVKTEILRAQKREVEENLEKDPLNRKERLSGAPVEIEGNKRPTLSSNDDDKSGAPDGEKKRVLFPITLVPWAALEKWEYPASSGVDLAEEIRQYFIPDFSKWKDHDSYQKAFQRLVGDLKAVAKSAAG